LDRLAFLPSNLSYGLLAQTELSAALSRLPAHDRLAELGRALLIALQLVVPVLAMASPLREMSRLPRLQHVAQL
jgi:hypothetical protein